MLNSFNHNYWSQDVESEGDLGNYPGWSQNGGEIKPMNPTIHDYMQLQITINHMPPFVYDIYKFGYSVINDLFVALQSLVLLNPINIDATYPTPREKLNSGINAITTVMPIVKIRELHMYGKTVNAGQFNTLFKGSGITAATDAGKHIRHFNYVERDAQQFIPFYQKVSISQTVFPYLYQTAQPSK